MHEPPRCTCGHTQEGHVMLATDQEVGLFVRPLLPRLNPDKDKAA